MPSTGEAAPTNVDEDVLSPSSALSRELKVLIERTYGVQFSILDGETGETLFAAPGQPSRDWTLRAEVCREAVRHNQPEFIDDEDPLVALALPLVDASGRRRVAVATFLSRPIEPDEDLSRAAELLGMSPEAALDWAQSQSPWPPEALKRVSDLVLDHDRAKRRAMELQREADSLSINLASTYEEISLLHRLTQNLKLSMTDEDLGRVALEWMKEVVPAEELILQFLPTPGADKSPNRAVRLQPVLLCRGTCPIGGSEFSELVARLGGRATQRPVVVNRPVTGHPDWPYPRVRELILVAMSEGENVFGWLAAINHVEGGEFGTIEASLLGSVATILGIHGGNVELYRQQSDLLAGIVRALTSAIDAKDPYTCGHSDRVARVAVRLAEELGCDEKTLNTLYLAGLLHDIGKIGIDDNVLRKASELSGEEYKHIKQHVQIGHRILNDLAKLEDVLPVVLYHHEAWDGGGYPHRLASDRIPLPARIVAVADAFDAMTSNRPYRHGMPDATVDRILRAGAGQQWDPVVIDAFFRARDDIRRICRETGDRVERVGAASWKPEI